MTTPPASGPVSIPPPNTVRIAAVLVAAEGLALIVLAAINALSGLRNEAEPRQLWAQVAYFVVLGAAVVLVASGLLRGRRWSRSPALVVEVVVIAIGMWMAFPSDQLRWGAVVIAVGAAALALLVTPAANHWIKQFPQPFGLGQGR